MSVPSSFTGHCNPNFPSLSRVMPLKKGTISAISANTSSASYDFYQNQVLLDV